MTSGPGKIEELQKLFQNSSQYTHLQARAKNENASFLFLSPEVSANKQMRSLCSSFSRYSNASYRSMCFSAGQEPCRQQAGHSRCTLSDGAGSSWRHH